MLRTTSTTHLRMALQNRTRAAFRALLLICGAKARHKVGTSLAAGRSDTSVVCRLNNLPIPLVTRRSALNDGD